VHVKVIQLFLSWTENSLYSEARLQISLDVILNWAPSVAPTSNSRLRIDKCSGFAKPCVLLLSFIAPYKFSILLKNIVFITVRLILTTLSLCLCQAVLAPT
jgi:hypothetical protein